MHSQACQTAGGSDGRARCRQDRGARARAPALLRHVEILKEAAGIDFGGGITRGPDLEDRRSAQRAIFHVQRALESIAGAGTSAVVVCDRGTIDVVALLPDCCRSPSTAGLGAPVEGQTP